MNCGEVNEASGHVMECSLREPARMSAAHRPCELLREIAAFNRVVSTLGSPQAYYSLGA